jgi:hypothetical protein
MKIVLRVIAFVIALGVALQAAFIYQFALRGGVGSLVRSGSALGVTTIVGWLLVLTAGPVAAIQLWRLRRIGLFLSAALFGIALIYYVIGFLFLRHPEAPVSPIIEVIVVNALFLAPLLSPGARRVVS